LIESAKSEELESAHSLVHIRILQTLLKAQVEALIQKGVVTDISEEAFSGMRKCSLCSVR
jgi:hypothetical protein